MHYILFRRTQVRAGGTVLDLFLFFATIEFLAQSFSLPDLIFAVFMTHPSISPNGPLLGRRIMTLRTRRTFSFSSVIGSYDVEGVQRKAAGKDPGISSSISSSAIGDDKRDAE